MHTAGVPTTPALARGLDWAGIQIQLTPSNSFTHSPLNTVCTVAKYDPMGTTIMAKVNARSLTMTSLPSVRQKLSLSSHLQRGIG